MDASQEGELAGKLNEAGCRDQDVVLFVTGCYSATPTKSLPPHRTSGRYPPIIMTESSGSTDGAKPDRELEGGRLYAVLTYNDDFMWKWAFFIPNPIVSPIGKSGTIFQVTEIQDSRNWKFVREEKDVLSWPLVVAIVQLGEIEFLGEYDELMAGDDLVKMFTHAKLPSSDGSESSRTWFLDAVSVLHDCGVLTCEEIPELEKEIRRYAFKAMDRYMQREGEYSLLWCRQV